MRVSKLFGETLRQPPADAGDAAQQLLLRAGYLRKTAAGAFVPMPLAWRSLQKIERLLRNIFDAFGGQEMWLPPFFSENNAGFETAAAQLCVSEIRSHRQLPQLLYQFRHGGEAAEKTGGAREKKALLRLNACSLDRNEAELGKYDQIISNAFQQFFDDIHLPVSRISTESRFGEKQAHAFVWFSAEGGTEALFCRKCNISVKHDIAKFQKDVFITEPQKPLKKIATPEAGSIQALSDFLGIDPRQTAKIVFYTGSLDAENSEILLVCVARGDMEISDAKVRRISGARSLRPATAAEILTAGCVPGFASPININRAAAIVIVDELVTRSPNLVAGANEADFHFLNSNYERDYEADIVGDIALAPKNARCMDCGGLFHAEKCVEIAHLDAPGDALSRAENAAFLDENGKPQPIYMGSHVLDLGQLLFCLAGEHRDDFGLMLPPVVAPFDVALVVLKGEEPAKIAEQLYRDLLEAGVAVLFDDRNVSPGVKFKDADLRGMPLRITVSERSLQQGGVEFKLRSQKERSIVPLQNIAGKLRLFLRKISRDATGNYS